MKVKSFKSYFSRRDKFSIRKLTVGVVSLAIASLTMYGALVPDSQVLADEVPSGIVNTSSSGEKANLANAPLNQDTGVQGNETADKKGNKEEALVSKSANETVAPKTEQVNKEEKALVSDNREKTQETAISKQDEKNGVKEHKEVEKQEASVAASTPLGGEVSSTASTKRVRARRDVGGAPVQEPEKISESSHTPHNALQVLSNMPSTSKVEVLEKGAGVEWTQEVGNEKSSENLIWRGEFNDKLDPSIAQAAPNHGGLSVKFKGSDTSAPNYRTDPKAGWDEKDQNLETTSMWLKVRYKDAAYYNGQLVDAIATIRVTPSKNRTKDASWAQKDYSDKRYNPMLQLSNILYGGWAWQNVKQFQIDLKLVPSGADESKALSLSGGGLNDSVSTYYTVNSLDPAHKTNGQSTGQENPGAAFGPEYVRPEADTVSKAYVTQDSHIQTSYSEGPNGVQYAYNGGTAPWGQSSGHDDDDKPGSPNWNKNSVLFMVKDGTNHIKMTLGNLERAADPNQQVQRTNYVWATMSTASFVEPKAKGSVIVKYVNEQGQEIKGQVTDTEERSLVDEHGKIYEYDTTDHKPQTIDGTDGKKYTFEKIKEDSAPERGMLVKGVSTVTYVYKEVKKDDKAQIIYREVGKDGKTVVKELEHSGEITGKEGEEIQYSTQDKIKEYKKKGYDLVKDGFKPGTKFDGKDGVDTFYVDLKPRIVPITPEKPVTPNNPVDPNDPDTPNYPEPNNPDAKDPAKLQQEVKRTVKYFTEENGVKTPIAESTIPTKEDVLKFRREGSINLVTGETTLGDWKLVENGKDYSTAGEETGEFKSYTSPVHKGYLLKDGQGKEAGAHTGVKATDGDLVDEVVYVPISNYVPKVPNDPSNPSQPDPKFPHDPWGPGKPNVPYTNDPNDPGKIVPPTHPDQPQIPYVPGYTPKDPKGNPLKPVDPNDPKKGYIPPVPEDPTKPTEIPYEKNPDPKPEPKPQTPNDSVPTPKPQEPSKTAPTLPNTGTESSELTTIIGTLIAIIGLGIVGKRRRED